MYIIALWHKPDQGCPLSAGFMLKVTYKSKNLSKLIEKEVRWLMTNDIYQKREYFFE